MKVTVINPCANAKDMTKRYITALYGCSMVEFARNLEKEKLSRAANSQKEDLKQLQMKEV